jgi:aminoglycoside 3-N-acetyltransferase
MNAKRIIKAMLGIKQKEELGMRGLIRCWHRRLGPYFYKKKFSPDDVTKAMMRAGMKRGSVVMIQSSWGEFYNCTGTPQELIEAILQTIGPEGTLCMAAMPVALHGKPFDVVNTPTRAGWLAECFRRYPGVKRSINVRHSVCAIGPQADYLLGEHHLGETAWDEKSPYYKLSQIGGLCFGLGLGPYWIGTIEHCVDSLLKDKIDYYTDLWDKKPTRYDYIDYDGQLKYYYNYSMPESGLKMRISGYFKQRHIANKYLNRHYQQVSNLQICCFEAKELVEELIRLARKGINSNLLPLKWGYKFEE